jgi:DNA-binding NtrC family response regulator
MNLSQPSSALHPYLGSFRPRFYHHYYRHMNLQSLLVCSDERILRVLRRVLDELEIQVEHCADPTAATKLLARQTFEAVIVDCAEEGNLSLLKSIRMGQRNKKSVAVAIIDEQTALRRAFGMGAHFVVFKAISCERAKSSFRAAKSPMKRERRRSVRCPARSDYLPSHYQF